MCKECEGNYKNHKESKICDFLPRYRMNILLYLDSILVQPILPLSDFSSQYVCQSAPPNYDLHSDHQVTVYSYHI